MAYRQLKSRVLALLRSPDLSAALDAICHLAPRQVVNPLFGLLCHGEPLIRWRAVTAMGVVVSQLAEADMEAARIIMRRFMWSLNDESGGIGWGSPEAMGEIMARHAGLACEYGCILVSYADPEGNYLEHPGLQKGLLWGLGRLGRARPDIACNAVEHIRPFLNSSDPDLLGLALWALMPFGNQQSQSVLRPLLLDHRHLTIYMDNELTDCVISELSGMLMVGGRLSSNG